MALVHEVHIQSGDNHSHITISTYVHVAAVDISATCSNFGRDNAHKGMSDAYRC